jgi:hypothetical protein
MFGNEVSEFQKIIASIIQSLTPGNLLDKYAEDTYLIIPATNVDSCTVEIAHIEDWPSSDILRLNQTKSAEIVFVALFSKHVKIITPPALPEIARVELIKVLRVIVVRRFSVAEHIDAVQGGCAQTVFALRILQQHRIPVNALHTF